MAIDFGTSYSGFAFSFNKGQEQDAIFMNHDWTNEQGGKTNKAPTCLLLTRELKFDSFGYDAMDNYAHLQDDEEEQEYFFFQHFKMALHSDKVSSVICSELTLFFRIHLHKIGSQNNYFWMTSLMKCVGAGVRSNNNYYNKKLRLLTMSLEIPVTQNMAATITLNGKLAK